MSTRFDEVQQQKVEWEGRFANHSTTYLRSAPGRVMTRDYSKDDGIMCDVSQTIRDLPLDHTSPLSISDISNLLKQGWELQNYMKKTLRLPKDYSTSLSDI